MMKFIITLTLLLSVYCNAQYSQFDAGFQKGYKEGYCYQRYGCIPPIPPLTPLSELTDAKTQIGGNPTTDATPGILVLADTNKAMILPKTTYDAVINPAAGMMIYDTTAKQLAVFNGSKWSFWKP